MEQIKAPTARDLRSFGGSVERYYECMKERLAAKAAAEAFNATPAGKMEAALIAAGGKPWEQDGKRRVYFNSEFLGDGKDSPCATGYFDVIANAWVLVSSSQNAVTAEAFGAAMAAKISRK